MPGMPEAAPERPVIGFLTDFGLDGAAATCKGVILSICREAQIVDICHTVRKFAVRDGGYILRATLPYLPVGVHLAIVDPGVGTARRGVAIRTGRGDVLVGPDNGLLRPAAEKLGGAVSARSLENRAYWLAGPTSSTFHGRDIFAPVAGHLAAGSAGYDSLGPELAPGDLFQLAPQAASVQSGALETVVTYVDSFGNLRLAGGKADLEAALGALPEGQPLVVELGAGSAGPRREPTTFGLTFGSVPQGWSVLYVDSSGGLALADNQGSAAARLGVTADCPVRIVAA
jgi:S-adenosylmethionine hydrolase